MFAKCPLLSAISFTILLAGCHAVEQQESRNHIIGGTPVAKDEWVNVVAITETQGLPFGLPPLSPEQMELIRSELLPKIKCTGTAITDRLIVTAAHCLLSLTSLPDGPVELHVGTGLGVEGGKVDNKVEKLSMPLLDIESSGVHPLYSTENLGYDIAYIVLKKPLDLPESAYARVLTDADEEALLLQPGLKVTNVGYGARSNASGDKAPTGTKQIAELTLFDPADEKADDGHTAWDPKTEIVVKDLGKGSCRGDSGGPLFAQLPSGDWRLFGIVSRAYGQDTCDSYSTIFGLLPRSICWVQTSSHIDLKLPEGYCSTQD